MQRAATTVILGLMVGLTPFEQTVTPPDATGSTPRPRSEVPAVTAANEGAEADATVEAEPPPPASTAPRPKPLEGQRKWTIREAPLAGAEPSWGPPGQVPEYTEVSGPEPEQKGPPSRGTGRIVTGAILGPIGLALAISGIVGASTSAFGEHKNLSAPMIGAGLVSTAVGAALLADGILRRKRFLRWQAKVAVAASVVPGRMAGATLVLRF